MKKFTLFTSLGITILIGVSIFCFPSKTVKMLSMDLSFNEFEIFEITNAEREKKKVPPLELSYELCKAAKLHAQNMANLNRMSHVLSIKGFETMSQRVKWSGYEGGSMGENIAMGQKNPAAAMVAWVNSPGHYSNIMGRGYTDIGVGIAYNEKGTPFYCQVFGSK
jgi:uncharacterized protein YkwD